ncbi:MAG TPA: hypothetical protein VM008_19450 [Phycisphaerae bacterium]|nr:hypothetical protein [Phycisphaerae bacterium]
MTRAQLLPEIFKLDVHDQLLIVEAIRSHLQGKIDPANEAEFKAQLDRLIADAESNPDDEVEWETLYKELGNP